MVNNDVLDMQHQAQITMTTKASYCDDTPSFSGATETSCTQLMAIGEECYTVCPSSTVVSTCSRVYADFNGFKAFLGDTHWVHSNDCIETTNTRTIEVDGITVGADSVDDCEDQMEEYLEDSLIEDLSNQCDSCDVVVDFTCSETSRRRRTTSGEFDVAMTMTFESTTTEDEVIDVSNDSFLTTVEAAFQDADEVAVSISSIEVTRDTVETNTEVFEVEMVSGFYFVRPY